MPPRGRAKPEVDDDDSSDECARLRQLARDAQMLSEQRRTVAQEAQQLPQYLVSADGKDIVKKSSTRKGRYLFHISAEFQPAVGGRMGTLAKLDSKNPVLYIDFPSGRLKLIGTLLFPKTKYQLLKLGGKDVLCEDIFESVVLFAEMQWVGSKEANPSEAPLEMPEELQAPILRKSATDDAAASGELRPARRQRSPASQPASQPATQPASQPATQPASQPASQRSRGAGAPRSSQKRRRDAATPDSSSEDDDDAVEGTQPLSQRTHLGRSSKAAAQKKLLEVSDGEEEEEADIDDAASSGNDGSDSSGDS